MSITQITDATSNVVDLPRKIRIRRRSRGPDLWLAPVLLLVASLAYMVGRLSSY